MKNVFDELRDELKSVDRWLDEHLKLLLPPKERELAAALRRYIVHCHRDKRKWRSESAAASARIKVKDAWITLFSLEAERRRHEAQ